MRTRVPRPNLPGLLWLAWAGCGSAADPTTVPRAGWGRAAAAVECAQIFGCCDATERMTWSYADEVQCQQARGAQQQTAIDDVVLAGQMIYDPKAARRCLDEAAAIACMQIPAGGVGHLLGTSCPNVARGALPEGAACEDLDAICASGNCTGTCAPPRPCWQVTCDAGQYCDPKLPGCTPLEPDDAACITNVACTPPSVCLTTTGACSAPLPDGAPCGVNTDCESANCTPSGAGGGTCRSRICDGV